MLWPVVGRGKRKNSDGPKSPKESQITKKIRQLENQGYDSDNDSIYTDAEDIQAVSKEKMADRSELVAAMVEALRSKKGNYVEFHWLEICRVRGAVIKNVRRPPIG